MQRFAIRVLLLLAIGVVHSGCAAPSESMALRAPISLTALASGRSTALMGRVLAALPQRRDVSSSIKGVYPDDQATGKEFHCVQACSACSTIGSGLGGSDSTQSSVAQTSITYHIYVALTFEQKVAILSPTGSGSSCPVVGTLFGTGGYAGGASVGPEGSVGVTNICSAPSCGPGDIAFYAPGAIYPSYFATGLLSRFYFGAFDKAGNFYNDGLTEKGEAAVGVVPVGSTTDMPTGISGISFPGGIRIANDGTINVLDQACPCIQQYKGYKAHHHVGTISLLGVTDPVTFSLDEKNHYLWVTDAANGTVDQFRYPAGGSIKRSFSGFVDPIGVALIPPDNP
jgi:hypothetical protein